MNWPLVRWLAQLSPVQQHVLFWLGYYVLRVAMYAEVVNTTEKVMVAQLMELPVKVGVVYLNLYVLMPRLVQRRHYVLYGLALLGSLLLGTWLQRYVLQLGTWAGIYGRWMPSLFSFHRFLIIGNHIVMIVLVTAIMKIVKDYYEDQKDRQELIRQKLQAELRLLKTQVNPHFFFNTLNNLYALALQQSPNTPELILRLSELMSYLIYEAHKPAVPLARELAFLQDYVALERLRFGDELAVQLVVRGAVAGQGISPLMLVPVAENCFKHGPLPGDREAYIRLEVEALPGHLRLRAENTFPDAEAAQRRALDTREGGIGLQNLRRQLQLLYPNSHRLTVEQSAHMYCVLLELPLLHMPEAPAVAAAVTDMPTTDAPPTAPYRPEPAT